ncbi:MAG: response regulator [Eubacterium sp.]|nr:response regulator [Eubacterium sp.]
MNYISTMIVDDDRILLDDLIHTINWEKQGFQIVATASNGVQALKFYHQYHPQLIITDIVMPVMNGIELLKEIRRQDNAAYILMLSSYDDFNYAKESINYHANSYVLKDEINTDTLTEKLDQAKKVIASNTKQAAAEKQAAIFHFFTDEEQNILPVSENTGCSLLFEEKFCFFLLELASPVFPAQLVSEHPEESADRPSSVRSGTLSAIVSEIRNTAFSGSSPYTAAPISKRHILILTKQTRESSLTKKQQDIIHYLNGICRQLYQNHRIASACFYSAFPQTLEEFRNLYQHHCFSKRYFTHGTENGLIENIHDLKPAKYMDPRDITLFDLPSSLNDPHFVSESLCSFLEQYGDPYLFYGQEQIILQLFHLLDRIWFSSKKERIVPPVLYTYREFAEWYTKMCEELAYTKANGQNALSLPVKLTIENINREYPNPGLNITFLANKVYLSASYLSTLFKSETGKSINEFITKVRIEKAKSLLQNPKLKIYEIASLTGYSSSQYFSQSFLKATGMMPKQYRRNLQK